MGRPMRNPSRGPAGSKSPRRLGAACTVNGGDLGDRNSDKAGAGKHDHPEVNILLFVVLFIPIFCLVEKDFLLHLEEV